MKKILLALLGLLILAPAAWAAELRVATQEDLLRKDRKFFAPIVARAPYGEVLQDGQRSGDWYRVRYGGAQGWIHKNQVTTRTYRVSGGRQVPEATRDEVALAGKGFTPDVERTYRGKNPELNYEAVSRVESIRVSDSELEAFIRSGKLREGGDEG